MYKFRFRVVFLLVLVIKVEVAKIDTLFLRCLGFFDFRIVFYTMPNFIIVVIDSIA